MNSSAALTLAPFPNDADDEMLVDRALQGDREAFDVLFRRHLNRVTGVAARYTKDPAVVQDIVSTAFLKAFIAMRTFQGKSHFSTWLHRIVVNTAFDTNERAAKHEVVGFDESLSAIPCDQSGSRQGFGAEQGPAEDEVISALCRLSEEDRRLLELRVGKGMSYESLAKLLGVAIGTIKSRLHRARAHLRSKIAP